MADAPLPPSCTILGSAVPAVKPSTRSVWNCHFVCPTGPNAISLESPCLAHCPSPVQSDGYANLPSEVSDCRFNRAPGPVRFVWRAVECRCAVAPATGCTSQNCCAGIPHLSCTWKFPCPVGNKDPSGNAALTHPPSVHQELQSWVVLTMPS